MNRLLLILALTLAAGATAGNVAAQTATPPSAAQKIALRYPQAVRVGDLIGRRVLAPHESQPVLGHVVAITKGADGSMQMIMRQASLLGGGALVTVPLDQVALLGEHVALPDYDEAHPPTFAPVTDASPVALGANETIKMALTKPFH